MTDAAEVRLVVDRAKEVLPPVPDWQRPPGYPDSLALCVLDSMWSLSVRYRSVVVPVVNRYREHARAAGRSGDNDNASQLFEVITESGGPEGFAAAIGTSHRTSTRAGAPMKAEAVMLAAKGLSERGVETPAGLLAAGKDLHRWWRTIPGQRSSDVGWRYLNLLAGAEQVKPDRMVRRSVTAAVGRDVTDEQAADLVIAAAKEFQVSPVVLDHAVWKWESTRRRRKRS